MHGSNFPHWSYLSGWIAVGSGNGAAWPWDPWEREREVGRKRKVSISKSISGGGVIKRVWRKQKQKSLLCALSQPPSSPSPPHTLTSSWSMNIKEKNTDAGRDNFFSSKRNRQMLSITGPAEKVADWVYNAHCSSYFLFLWPNNHSLSPKTCCSLHQAWKDPTFNGPVAVGPSSTLNWTQNPTITKQLLKEWESERGARRWSKWKIGHLWVTIPFLLKDRPFISLPVWLIDQPRRGVHTPLYWEQQLTLQTAAESGCCLPQADINKQVNSEGHTVTEAMSPDFLSLHLLSSSPFFCGPFRVKFVSRYSCGRWVAATGFKRASPSPRKTACARQHLGAIDDTTTDWGSEEKLNRKVLFAVGLKRDRVGVVFFMNRERLRRRDTHRGEVKRERICAERRGNKP